MQQGRPAVSKGSVKGERDRPNRKKQNSPGICCVNSYFKYKLFGYGNENGQPGCSKWRVSLSCCWEACTCLAQVGITILTATAYLWQPDTRAEQQRREGPGPEIYRHALATRLD